MNVLCVDDDEELLYLTKVFLGEGGTINVTPVSSANSALDLLRKGEYDAIISDYNMPEMNGIDFLKTLRRKGDRTPFIFLTSSGREEVIKDAVNNGANSFIQRGEGMAAFRNLRSTMVQLSQVGEMTRKFARRGDNPQSAIYDFSGPTCLYRSGTMVHANADCARLFGFEIVNEMMNEPSLAWALPELHEEVLDRLLNLELRRTSNFIHVMPMQRADGSRFKAMINDTHIELEDGPACLIRCWDISDHKKVSGPLQARINGSRPDLTSRSDNM
ncbi:MAG: response regulator [Methanomassiliicoccus sp.]|nr:response regulator [Methanomassiliicoccus sp.]